MLDIIVIIIMTLIVVAVLLVLRDKKARRNIIDGFREGKQQAHSEAEERRKNRK